MVTANTFSEKQSSEAKTDAIKQEYVVYVCKRWDSETGEAMPDNETQYSLGQLEQEKKRWDDEMQRAKGYSDGLALAIEDFKKL